MNLISSNASNFQKPRAVIGHLAFFFLGLTLLSSAQAQEKSVIDETGFKSRAADESEFDNQSESFVKDWRDANPDYDDTVFGEQMYNEPSTPTKLEMLRLLSKDTPSLLVFMTAVSMGLGIDEVLQAAVKYDPSKGRDLASSAVNLLPVLTDSNNYLYSSYELEDLEREDDSQPYSVERVVKKFFEERLVLRPYPDWFDGQYHFLASAAELQRIQAASKRGRWYNTKSTEKVSGRPIFVSLYEATGSVLIDGEDRITEVLKEDPDARLPVVFIFNRLNERAIDEIAYPRTIRGLHDAYIEKNLILTPTPEWQLGEYHTYAKVEEFYEIFQIPEEEDFEPEAWQKLIREAEAYSVTNTAFLLVIVGGDDNGEQKAKLGITSGQLYAAWDDPRTEQDFKYTPSKDGDPITLENILGKGLIFNRPDLIAALNALGVTKVPVAFYYIDSSRVKPYTKGPRSLIQAAIGAGTPPGSFGDGGGFTPPPQQPLPPASPPGIQ